MIQFIYKIIINTFAILIASWILSKGIHVDNNLIFIVVAIVLSLLNTFLRPLLVFLTIPFTFFTFGLFIFIINAGMVMLAGELVPGFHIESFKWALLFSLIYPVIRFILDLPEKIRSKQIYIKVQRKKDNEDFPDDFEDGID